MTKADKERIQAIADLGCIVCRLEGLGKTPAEVHHIRSDVGMGQRSKQIIPLCPLHHRLGGWGYALHGGQAEFEKRYGTELELVAAVENLLE